MDWTASYHTHTYYSDGTGSVDDVIQAAIAAGLTQIGLSCHAPLPYATDWAMKADRIGDYVREIQAAQGRYRGRIQIFLASEVDYIPDDRVRAFQEDVVLPQPFDYLIGSVHSTGHEYPPYQHNSSREDFEHILTRDYSGVPAMVSDYYARVRQMLDRPGLRIVGHLDLIKHWNEGKYYFREDEPWYRAAVEETLQAIRDAGVFVELNTSAWYKGLSNPYPSPWILERCRDLGIPVLISSDAHQPQNVTRGFERAAALLQELGIVPRELSAATVER